MEGKRRWRGWRKAIPVGVAVIVVLLLMMVVGLAIRHNREEGTIGMFQGAEETGERPDEYGIKSSSGEAESGAVARDSLTTPASKTTEGKSTTVTNTASLPSVEVKTIKTGTLTIEIKKDTFNQQYGRVVLIAETSGGYVSDSRSNSDGSRITGGTITIRVPNDSYSKVLDDLKELGKVTSIGEESQDVTEEYVDLESRIKNLRAQEAVYIRLMGEAKTIEESISVQGELSVIQEQIEQLAGRRNYLDNHVQFSSVQVNLMEPGAGTTGGGEGWGFTDALSDAAHGVVDGFNAVVRFLGNALVYILIVALVVVGVYYFLRSRRHGKPDAGGVSSEADE